MHLKNQDKASDAFWKEFEAILAGSSAHHRPKDRYDFRSFVFPDTHFKQAMFTKQVNFGWARFTGEADFTWARFTEEANFSQATFIECPVFYGTVFVQGADFTGTTFASGVNFMGAMFDQVTTFLMATFTKMANFWGAKFTKGASFGRATFKQGADFKWSTFAEEGIFNEAVFGPKNNEPNYTTTKCSDQPIADFRFARFLRPEMVDFTQVNKNGQSRLRARFVNCDMEAVRFEAVRWHKQGSRMMLQDEIDRVAHSQEATDYEEVAIAYRRLINNFEKARAYDLAEDCSIGAMEMKRLDPGQPFSSRAMVNLYHCASFYGSNYWRALVVLLGFVLVVFPLFFWLAGLTQNPGKGAFAPDGLIHSLEVATFQANTHHIATNGLAWGLEILERIFVPAQLALFLLALRRRFRR